VGLLCRLRSGGEAEERGVVCLTDERRAIEPVSHCRVGLQLTKRWELGLLAALRRAEGGPSA
jgi:hypothetical protein